MQYDLFNQPKYKFFSLGSGSSGNCYFLGSRQYGILIDAGVGVRTIKKSLREYGIAFENIVGILITHDHADHIKTLGALGGKFNIPIYTTQAIHGGIDRSRYIDADLSGCRRIISKEETFAIKDFQITAFDVPHDSIENLGYRIEFEGQTFVLITDMGRVTDAIQHNIKLANHLVIEANYDEEMLRNGRYPEYLKQRITSGNGHISNRLSADLVSQSYSPNLKNVWLCHLSQDNNTPDIAYSTFKDRLQNAGAKVGDSLKLEVLSRYKSSGLREF